MSTKKDPKKEEGPSGKEIFVGGSQKTSSEMDKKIFKDLQEEQTINIDEIMEMYIAQLEQDNNLRNKYNNGGCCSWLHPSPDRRHECREAGCTTYRRRILT